MEFIDATSARQMTKEKLKERSIGEIEEIMEMIKDAINECKFCVWINNRRLQEDTKIMLSHLNYKVEEGKQYNEVGIVIKW